MANFDIPDNPEFSNEIRKFETTDPAHADLLNTVNKQLFENTLVLKKQVDNIQENYVKGAGIELSMIDGILTVTYDDGTPEGSEE